MASVNKIILIGNVGQVPVLRHFANGEPVANLSLATNAYRKDGKGDQKEITDWHRLRVVGPLAEFASQAVKKGAQVYIEGELHYTKWKDKNVQRYSADIVVTELKILGAQEDSCAKKLNAPTSPATTN